MTSKRILWFVILFVCCTTFASAQGIQELLFGKGSKTDYIGQHMDGRKLKNGLGVMRLKGGAIYAGDFSEGKMSGKGMIISPDNPISNAPGATFYVGSFFNGKKERKGTLYDSNGDIIYQGQFVADKPVETFPMENPPLSRYFTMKDLGDILFWGEVEEGIPEGFGLMVQADGSIWIGTFVDGEQSGLCITMCGEKVWEVGRWSLGSYNVISSSEIQSNRRAEFVTAQRKIRNDLFKGLMEVANGLIEMGNQMASVNSDSSADYDDTSESSTGKGSSSSSIKSKAKNECGTAWRSADQAYHNYESQLIRDAGSLSASDVTTIKGKMKSIRTKWEARGCNITKSPYE